MHVINLISMGWFFANTNVKNSTVFPEGFNIFENRKHLVEFQITLKIGSVYSYDRNGISFETIAQTFSVD